ncbi:30S ribosomal protein S6 [Candidatus Vidania fulgoroideorum]
MKKYYEAIIILNRNINFKIENKIKKTFEKLNFIIIKTTILESKDLQYNIKGYNVAYYIRILFKTDYACNILKFKNNINIDKYLIRYLIIKSENKFINKNKIDFLDKNYMNKYIDEFGKIKSFKLNKLKKKDQKKISKYIKISRFLSIISY